MTATRIQDYARRQVRAVDARPHRHHKGPTGDGSNRGAEEAGRRHWSAAPNKAQRMPRVLNVEVNHEASQTNGSATPSAFWQIRGYAVVTATGNQVRFEAMAHARNHRVGRRGDVRNREKEAGSEEPELAETRYAVTDYEVIQNADVDQREGLAQSAGDELVGLRR